MRFEDISEAELESIATPLNTVLPFLCIGNLAAAVDHALLQLHQITHILQIIDNYNGGDYPPKVGVREVMRLPLADHPDVDMTTHFDAAFEFIEKAREEEGRVLVHCQMGQSRSATVVIAYLIRKNGWNAQKALAELKKARPCVKPNEGFMVQLELYASNFYLDHYGLDHAEIPKATGEEKRENRDFVLAQK
ncbi:hypothetical protein HDU96_000155 [Phlyctochytrium bullatum]|nr:hypothetical protein HDU96_000155 [Phlyctochytrium bullatum]